MKFIQYTPIVDALLDHAKNLTESDFVDLALAAIDQSDIPPDVQSGIRSHILGGAAIRDARRDRERAEACALRAKAEASGCRMCQAESGGLEPLFPHTCGIGGAEVASCTQGDYAGMPRRHGKPGLEAMDICQDVSCPLQPPHIRARSGGR